MITKERFRSFPQQKRYLIAASDFARAASLLKKESKGLAENSVDIGYKFLNYLFEDDASLKKKFPSLKECKDFVQNGKYSDIYEVYLELMELGGIPKLKVREAEK